MKTLAVVSLVVAVAATVHAESLPTCPSPAPSFDSETLGHHVSYLASPELDGRAPGTAGDRAAREYLVQQFRCIGLSPAGDDGGFEQAFTTESKARTANVIGFIAGTDKTVGSEIILVTAHHDHLGDGHLGANDNASGIAGLLAIASWVSQQKQAPRRTIAFMAFGAEEEGMVGSTYYVGHPAAALPVDRIVQVINLDMIGSYRSKKYVAAMGTFPGMPSRTLLSKLDDQYPRLRVGMGGRARGSDFEPFCEAGIPYVFFWTPDARCYHERCDKTVDLPRMTDIAALARDLTWAMAQSEVDLSASRTKLGCFAKKK